MGRQPTYEEYSQIMTGFTPERVPVLNGLARAFGMFDHWFCEVPSPTFMNRSFWTAGTSSGLVVNFPAEMVHRQRRRDDLRAVGGARQDLEGVHGRADADLFHRHHPLPRTAVYLTSTLIEPALAIGHNDYHPAEGRALGQGVVLPGIDPPSSILGGEAFLARIYDA